MLCDTMTEMHMEVVKQDNIETRIEQLLLCQESASSIGATINRERVSDEFSNPVDTTLSVYCEQIIQLAQLDIVMQSDVDLLNDHVKELKSLISNLPRSYEVVFFPYNASMWDSLESVYTAFSKREDCRCYIVPIPYRRFDSANRKWVDCYEGGEFSSGLTLVHYSRYSLQNSKPDFAFIHNPYDDGNVVTRVYEEYFSVNLKKHVGKLVYIPYYVTTGEFTPEHKYLSAYKNVDYIILQSKAIKEEFADTPYYNKVHALGSPKLDTVIKSCEVGGVVPRDWGDALTGKKVLMLNTTIGAFLNSGKYLLNKLKSVFAQSKKFEKLVIIWRPHPLLGATIDSMRPDLRDEYEALVRYFKEEYIGIFDTTPDLNNVIALSDGYIGDDGSSVLNLFGIANKPVFIFNYWDKIYILKSENMRFSLAQLTEVNGEYYATSISYPGVFKVDKSLSSAKYLTSQPENSFSSLYNFSVYHNGNLYLSPLMTDNFYRYNVEKNTQEKMLQIGEPVRCMKVLHYQNKIVYLPQTSGLIVVYDTKKNKWKQQKFAILSTESNGRVYYDDSFGYVAVGSKVYIVSNHTNIVTCFDMESEKQTTYFVGSDSQAYIDITYDGEFFYLAGVYNSEVMRWDIKSNSVDSYAMPSGFVSWVGNDNRILPHVGITSYKDFIFTIPAYSSSIVKINKKTKKAELLFSELFIRPALETERFTQASLLLKKENILILQQPNSGKIIEIDLASETYKESYIMLSEEDFAKIKSECEGSSHGFYRKGNKETFCKRESNLFTFEEFAEDIVAEKLNDIKAMQEKSLSHIAENLDGSCGEKICQFCMTEIENQDS